MITSIERFNDLIDIVNMFSSAISEGNSDEFEFNGMKISLEKENGKVTFRIDSCNESQEIQNQAKELREKFKQALESLDDSLFLEVIEDLKKLDSKEFNFLKKLNDLLELEEYSCDEAEKLEELIEISSRIIREKLQNKIQELVDVYDKF